MGKHQPSRYLARQHDQCQFRCTDAWYQKSNSKYKASTERSGKEKKWVHFSQNIQRLRAEAR